ncbi:MAG: DoxX family protein [Verrucomicrobiota bacterium]
MKRKNLVWIAQIAVAIIIGQTLFFKFSDSPETVALFAELGLGPVHYKLIGLLELIAVALILVPRTVIYGAILSFGLMSGALMAHITELGFTGPHGTIGIMGIIAWTLSLAVIYVRRSEIPFIPKFFAAAKQTA